MGADDLPVVRFGVRSAERVAAVCGPGGTYESPIDDAACHLVIDSGEVVSIPDTRADPRVRDLAQIRDFSAASWLGVPVLDPDGHVIGNLCAMDSTVRHWTDTETATLRTLALAAGGEIALRLALRAADQHAAEASELADILERSLIPTHALELPGVRFGIHFAAGGTGVEVMGDFYDVFPVCRGDGFGVVIGDVCGQGALAARTTAMARSATRTAAHTEADPVQVLGIVNEVLHVWFAGHISFLTAAYATFDEIPQPVGRPRAWRVSLASAGHPPGFVRRADGTIEQLQGGGRVLGLFAESVIAHQTLQLRSGDSLVLFTDGISEAHCSGEADQLDDIGITDALAAAPPDAESVATALADAASVQNGHSSSDDAGVVVVQIERPMRGAPTDGHV
jgi:phosphoserine phosphatase RsbU/P